MWQINVLRDARIQILNNYVVLISKLTIKLSSKVEPIAVQHHHYGKSHAI